MAMWTWSLVLVAAVSLMAAILWLAGRGRKLRLAEAARQATTPAPLHDEIEDEVDPFPMASGYKKSLESEPSPPGPIAKAFGIAIGLLFAGIPFLVGIGIIGVESYVWLRTGHWPPLNLLDGVQIFFTNSWLSNPTDWLGLHSVLSKVPMSVALLAIGYGFYWMAFIAEE